MEELGANGDGGGVGGRSGGDEPEKVIQGTMNLYLNAGANGDGESFVSCVCGRLYGSFCLFLSTL